MFNRPVIVPDLTVTGHLGSATQTGAGLQLMGSGVSGEDALVVSTGATVKNIFSAPVITSYANVDIGGLLTVPIINSIVTPSADIAGLLSAPVVSTALFSVDIYVAPAGNDNTGTGCPSNPFQTLTRALAAVTVSFSSAGKTIHLAPGTYDGSPVITIPVSIVGTTTDSNVPGVTTLTGHLLVAIVATNSTHNVVTFNGITFTGSLQSTPSGSNIDYDLNLYNCTFTNAYLACLSTEHSSTTIKNSSFYVDLDVHAWSPIIYVQSGEIVMTNCRVTGKTTTQTHERYSLASLRGASVNSTISDCTFLLQLRDLYFDSNPRFYFLLTLQNNTNWIQNCSFSVVTLTDHIVGDPFPVVYGIYSGFPLELISNTFNIQVPSAAVGAVIYANGTTLSTDGQNVFLPDSRTGPIVPESFQHLTTF